MVFVLNPEEDNIGKNIGQGIGEGISTLPEDINKIISAKRLSDLTGRNTTENISNLASDETPYQPVREMTPEEYKLIAQANGPEAAKQEAIQRRLQKREELSYEKRNTTEIQKAKERYRASKRIESAAERLAPLAGRTGSITKNVLLEKFGLPPGMFGGPEGVNAEIMDKEVQNLLPEFLRRNYSGRILLAEVKAQIRGLVSTKNSPEAQKRLIEAIKDTGKLGQLEYKAMENVAKKYGRANPNFDFLVEKELDRLTENMKLHLTDPTTGKQEELTPTQYDELTIAEAPEETIKKKDEESSVPPTEESSPITSHFTAAIDEAVDSVSHLPIVEYFKNEYKYDPSDFAGNLKQTANLVKNIIFTPWDLIRPAYRTLVKTAVPEGVQNKLISETISDDPAFVEDLAVNVATFLTPGGVSKTAGKAAIQLGAAILPPITRKLFKEDALLKNSGNAVSIALMLGSFLTSVTRMPKEGLKYAGKLFQEAENAVPATAKLSKSAIAKMKGHINSITRLKGIDEVYKKKEMLGQVTKELWDADTAKDLISLRKLANSKFPQLKDSGKYLHDRLVNLIDETLKDNFSKSGWIKDYYDGVNSFHIAAQGIKNQKTIVDVAKKLKDPSLASFATYLVYHTLPTSLGVGAVAGSTVAVGKGVQAAKNVLSQMKKDPKLREMYLQLMKEITLENAPGINKQLNELAKTQMAED